MKYGTEGTKDFFFVDESKLKRRLDTRNHLGIYIRDVFLWLFNACEGKKKYITG